MLRANILNVGYQGKSSASAEDTNHFDILYSIVHFHKTLDLISRRLRSLAITTKYSFFPFSIDRDISNKELFMSHLKYIAENRNEKLCIIMITAHGGVDIYQQNYKFEIDNSKCNDSKCDNSKCDNSKYDNYIYGTELLSAVKEIAKNSIVFLIGNTCGFDSMALKNAEINSNIFTEVVSFAQEYKYVQQEIQIKANYQPLNIDNIIKHDEPAGENSVNIYKTNLTQQMLETGNQALNLKCPVTSREESDINYPIVIFGSIYDKTKFRSFIDAFCTGISKTNITYSSLLDHMQNSLIPVDKETVMIQSLTMLKPKDVYCETFLDTKIFSPKLSQFLRKKSKKSK